MSVHRSPLRIGVVGPAAPPAGGMAAQTEQLCRLLRTENLDVDFLQTNLGYRPQIVARIPGVRAVFRLALYLRLIWKLLSKVDVIHLMSNSGWSWQLFSAPVIWLAKLRKVPVVVNYRGGYAKEYLDKSSKYVLPTLKQASMVVVPSAFLEHIFSEFSVKAEIIPNIIDTSLFYPSDKQSASESRVLVARNLEEIYGIDVAIDAFAKVAKQFPELTLDIVGSGPEETPLKRRVAELKLEQRVRFLGRVGREEMANLFRQSLMMVNSSRIDNMPNSILEALACGIPVVTTDAGGIPYMVDDRETALISPVNDVDLLAENISLVLSDLKLKSHLISSGLSLVQRLKWSVVKDQWLSVYHRVTAQAVELQQ